MYTCIMQLGWPDMRLPIMYTMSFPERIPVSDKTWPRLDFTKANNLTFRAPDREKYPAMDLAYAAGRMAGTMTGVLSAANEQVGGSVFAFRTSMFIIFNECRSLFKCSWTRRSPTWT